MLRSISLVILMGGPLALASGPTYYRGVVPVLQRSCQNCHRPGEAAPMSFLDYASTRPWARAIKSAVQIKKMPPWSAEPNASHKFANDRSLREECTAHFDNSINNPYNPDPNATIHFGDQTWEEMMIDFFDVTIPPKTDPGSLFRARQQPTGD